MSETRRKTWFWSSLPAKVRNTDLGLTQLWSQHYYKVLKWVQEAMSTSPCEGMRVCSSTPHGLCYKCGYTSLGRRLETSGIAFRGDDNKIFKITGYPVAELCVLCGIKRGWVVGILSMALDTLLAKYVYFLPGAYVDAPPFLSGILLPLGLVHLLPSFLLIFCHTSFLAVSLEFPSIPAYSGFLRVCKYTVLLIIQ